MARPAMASVVTDLSSQQTYNVLKWLLMTSIAAALIHFPFHSSVYIRGPFGALGLMSAWLATGATLWAAIRVRERRFWRVLMIALAPFTYWTWQLYEAVHGRYV